MKTVKLSAVSKTDFNISNPFSMFQHWKEGSAFISETPRPTQGLIYFYGAEGEYRLKDKTSLYAKKGELVYLPQGAQYTTVFKNVTDDVSSILINFTLSDFEQKPIALFEDVTRIPVKDREYFKFVFIKAAEIANEINYSIPKLKAHLYKIFDSLGTMSCASNINHPQLHLIEKGIDYLENDGEQLLSIDEIAKMCNVSSAYFRRLFRIYSGKSPSEFRIDLKIDRAKRLLETRNFTVCEISENLNFSDVTYFSRLFKKKTGVSPKKYLNKSL